MNPSKVKTPKYYYHLTDEKWPKNKLLKPRSDGEKRDTFYEPDFSRICVSSSIEGCLVSIYLHDMERFRIYRTKDKTTALKPFDVWDADITDEYWLDQPTKFILIGELEKPLLAEFIESGKKLFSGMQYALGDGKKKTRNWQKETKLKIKKLLKKEGL